MPPAIVPDAAGAERGRPGLCNIFLLAIKHLAIFGAFIDGFYARWQFCASVCELEFIRCLLQGPSPVIILPAFSLFRDAQIS